MILVWENVILDEHDIGWGEKDENDIDLEEIDHTALDDCLLEALVIGWLCRLPGVDQ